MKRKRAIDQTFPLQCSHDAASPEWRRLAAAAPPEGRTMGIVHFFLMTYLFIARFLARSGCALVGARRRCSSEKRRAAFTSLADSDPGHLEARASRVRQHNKLLRPTVTDQTKRHGHWHGRGSRWGRDPDGSRGPPPGPRRGVTRDPGPGGGGGGEQHPADAVGGGPASRRSFNGTSVTVTGTEAGGSRRRLPVTVACCAG